MDGRKYRFFKPFLAVLVFFCFLIEVPSAQAGPAKRLLKRIGRAEVFLGGKAPKVLSLVPVKELKDSKSGEYVYIYKAVVLRASGDSGGSMVLLRAKTYGHALAKLLDVDPSSKRLFDTFFPVSIDKSPFPPLLLNYDYRFFIDEVGGWTRGGSWGTRTAKGKKKFVEYFSKGLQPGTYNIKLRTKIALVDHPVSSMYSMIEWFTFILKVFANPLDVVAGKIAGVYTDWFTKTGLAKNILKRVIKKALTESWVTYRLVVLAKVPKLKGMKPSQAVAELAARRLKYKSKDTKRCPDSFVNKVYRQKAGPGKKVKAGTVITLTVCRGKSTPTPTPKPTATATPAGLTTSNWSGTWQCADQTYGYDATLTISGIRAASTIKAVFPTWIYQPNREEYTIETLTDTSAGGTMILYDSHYPGEWKGKFTITVEGNRLRLRRSDDATSNSSNYLCMRI